MDRLTRHLSDPFNLPNSAASILTSAKYIRSGILSVLALCIPNSVARRALLYPLLLCEVPRLWRSRYDRSFCAMSFGLEPTEPLKWASGTSRGE